MTGFLVFVIEDVFPKERRKMTVTLVNIVGYTAMIVGTGVMLPQVVKLLQTKRAKDLSLGMVWLYFFSCLLWFTYGILIRASPVVIANGIGFVISGAQVFLRLKYR